MTARRIPTHNVDGLPSGSNCAYCGSMVCTGGCATFTPAEVAYTERLIAEGTIDTGRLFGEVQPVGAEPTVDERQAAGWAAASRSLDIDARS